jgi:hypothetical protein
MINPWAIVGALVLLTSVGFGGAAVGRKIERTGWQEKEIKTAQASQKTLSDAIANAQRIQLNQDATARKVVTTYENALSDLSKKYSAAVAIGKSSGLRVSRAICDASPLPTVGASTVSTDDGTADTVLLPSQLTESLYDAAKRADEATEQLRGLQEWIKAAGYYGEPP